VHLDRDRYHIDVGEPTLDDELDIYECRPHNHDNPYEHNHRRPRPPG
jgi:hypothetical protein